MRKYIKEDVVFTWDGRYYATVKNEEFFMCKRSNSGLSLIGKTKRLDDCSIMTCLMLFLKHDVYPRFVVSKIEVGKSGEEKELFAEMSEGPFVEIKDKVSKHGYSLLPLIRINNNLIDRHFKGDIKIHFKGYNNEN